MANEHLLLWELIVYPYLTLDCWEYEFLIWLYVSAIIVYLSRCGFCAIKNACSHCIILGWKLDGSYSNFTKLKLGTNHSMFVQRWRCSDYIKFLLHQMYLHLSVSMTLNEENEKGRRKQMSERSMVLGWGLKH